MSGALARRYHESTKHTWESVRRGGRLLDYRTRPHPFKEYATIDVDPVPPSLDRVLRLGAGVVRTRAFGHGTYHFRTYSSAGGLYPVELYVATPIGLFHYHPLEHALRCLRSHDVRGALAEAAADDQLARAEAVLVLTGILWRTAWKYGERGYRHVWWDAGTMLANILWLEPEAQLLTAFIDEKIDELVGADGRREFTVALVSIGQASRSPSELVSQSYKIDQALPPFRGEEDFPLVAELHEASRLTDAAAVVATRASVSELQRPPERLEEALRRRGSTREFDLAPLPRAELASLYAEAMAPVASDAAQQTRLAVIANAVDGLDPGAYDFESPNTFRIARAGTTRALAHRLTLEQELGGRAAAVAWFLADLDNVLETRGDRGYREAQLEAGIRAGRVQVGAFARGWGATASTFYDDEVRDAFATEHEPMLCAAVGRR